MNDLLDRTRAHLAECAPCLALAECEAFALLHAEAQFYARDRFRLWLEGVECLFFPVCDGAWHVRYAFNTGKGHYITPHYIGNPAGSIKTFEPAISYGRANINSANLDLVDHLHGARPAPTLAGAAV
ncbi:MAG: hypothetical protein L0229_29720 [Blastocatellia bacterium]|nr:hypothetical protein [Blastocatellia bacterium]